MLCDSCSERDAVVHLTTIENNAVHQLHSVRTVRRGARRRDDRRDAEASARRVPSRGASAGRRRRARTSAALHASATRRWRISARPDAGGARAATRISRRAFASCCDACTATIGTSAGRIARRCPRRSSGRRCWVSSKDRLRRAIESEQFELAADLRDRIRVME